MRNQHLYDFLRWKYAAEPVLERCGETYPVAVYKAPKQQRADPESGLLSLAQSQPASGDLLQDDSFRHLQALAGRHLENRPTFTMKRLVTGAGRIGLECELGEYFQALDTCDALGWELRRHAVELQGSSIAAFQAFDERLTQRATLHRRVANPVRDGSLRSAAIGVSTLIACRDGDRICLLLRQRSQRRAVAHAYDIHVVPSFMLQPVTSQVEEEFSVGHGVYHEYLEELFNVPEYEQGMGDWRYFYSDPRLAYLQSLIESGQACLYLTGIVVDLLNLRPEICTLLLIRSGDWYRHHSQSPEAGARFHLNDESGAILDANAGMMNQIGRVALESDEAMMKKGLLRPGVMVPPGAAAVWLGVDLLREPGAARPLPFAKGPRDVSADRWTLAIRRVRLQCGNLPQPRRCTMTVVKADEKGRLLIPRRDREALGVQPGDAFFVEREGQILRYVKTPNPFDTLGDEALADYRAGQTRNLRDILAKTPRSQNAG